MLASRQLPLLLAALLLAAGCASAPRGRPGERQVGVASWYGPGFHGRRTANGEVYDQHAMTAAHRDLPFDTVVEVRNRANGRRVKVRINDRGPFVRGRIIDLSYAAARAIAIVGPGTARVELTVLRDQPELAGPGWMVQAGAFRERRRADERARRVRRHGEVRVVREDGLHKVLLGPWRRHQDARRVSERLRDAGHEAFVRRPS